jgi:hypothetical protein
MTIDRSAGNKIWPRIAAEDDMSLALQKGLLAVEVILAPSLHITCIATCYIPAVSSDCSSLLKTTLKFKNKNKKHSPRTYCLYIACGIRSY